MLALRFVLFVLWAMLWVTVRRLAGRQRHPDWTWRLEVVAEVARWGAGLTAGVPVARVRAALPPAPLPPAVARRVQLASCRVGGLDAEQITPEGWRESGPLLLWLHGGGYVMCSPATHREMVARIARATRARCVVIDYRLAPEHPFPAAIEDCVAAYRALLADGVPADRLFVGGDSAGGGLCLAMLLRVRDAGEPLPVAAILASPWVDLESQGPTIDSHAPYDYVRRDLLATYASHYLGDVDPRHPEASAIHADLHGLPPLLIQTGGAEALRWENERLAERARTAGVEVRHEVLPGLLHGMQGFARFVPEARRAIGDIGAYVRDKYAERQSSDR